MTDWIEASGRTLEEAREAAANELGVPIDRIDVEVLDEGSKGLFGLGQPKVRIRARVPDAGLEGDFVTEESIGVTREDTAGAAEQGAGASAGEQAIGMLESVLAAMGFDARAKIVSASDEEIMVNISGAPDDLGRLIGWHGQTLDALQYLVGIAVNRGGLGRVRVLLDVEGYRERHQQALEARARDIAQQVKETGNEAVLEPQSARDRRIVHLALADDPDVYTYSEGDGEDRHVVISPKK